jgi:SAM-dependent methyltransferase
MENTDYLAFRAVAEGGWLRGKEILDVGCGGGRSSRFLKELGNEVTGIDVNPGMIELARKHDSGGRYFEVEAGASGLPFADESFDAIFSSWVLLEEARPERIVSLMRECCRILRAGGVGVIVTNTESFYGGEWLSCRVDFQENKGPLRSGQEVRAMLMPEGISVSDFFWSDEDYRDFFASAGLTVVAHDLPLGRVDEPLSWRDEVHTAPFSVYRVGKGIPAEGEEEQVTR